MPTTDFNRDSSDTHSWAIVTDWCWHSGPVVDSVPMPRRQLPPIELSLEQRFPIGADVTQCLLLQRSGGWGLDSAPEQPQLPGSWRHSWFRVAGQLGRIVRVRLKTSREAKITNMLVPDSALLGYTCTTKVRNTCSVYGLGAVIESQ